MADVPPHPGPPRPASSPAASEEALLLEARGRGTGATLRAWLRLSGPGWLQSAITLGGGSLASALYLGALTGYHLLWVQVVAMALGVVMLAAIGNVALATGERPFRLLRDRISPVLAWGWLVAVLLANVVWALPQFSLGTAAVQQNLAPGLAGDGGRVAICAAILVAAVGVVWSYDRGARGVRVFERLLKVLVGGIVIAFFGVVWALARSTEGLPWGEIARGFVPRWSSLSEPSARYAPFLEQARFADHWRGILVREQQQVLIAAAAVSVGINMTFLLPYSMLRRGWNRHFRGLATFDLATGLLIPFVLATGCVVVASADRFHARPDAALVDDVHAAAANPAYLARLDDCLRLGFGADSLQYARHTLAPGALEPLDPRAIETRVGLAQSFVPRADRELASMLERHDAFDLARALEPLTGHTVAQTVFGLGVLAMAVSTLIVLMLISGFAFAEAFGVEPTGRAFRWGSLAAGLGVLGPFVWQGSARFWLAVPTSNFGMVLLPIAYWSFFALMNRRSVLGDRRPRGAARWTWNTLMVVASGVATVASLHTVHRNLGALGLAGLAALLVLAAGVHVARRRPRA